MLIEEKQIAVVYFDELGNKKLVLVKNAEELDKLFALCIKEWTTITCFRIEDTVILNPEDEELKDLLLRNERTIIPYLILEHGLQLKKSTDYQKSVSILEDMPLFFKTYILKYWDIEMTFMTEKAFLQFLKIYLGESAKRTRKNPVMNLT